MKMTFKITNQMDYFGSIKENEKYYIKDDLLFDCIGFGCGFLRKNGRVIGFNAGKRLGYALLTYFSSQALGFRRLPYCEDRIYHRYFSEYSERNDILEMLTEKKVNNIISEAKDIYDHTQKSLKLAGLSHIQVRREIKGSGDFFGCRASLADRHGYAETLLMLKKASSTLGLNEVPFEMDTLNSFGDEGAYLSPIYIDLILPAKDIFYCSALIGNRNGESKTMESGEWVVINNSPTGVVRIPTNSIKYRKDLWDKSSLAPLTEKEAKAFMQRYKPIVFRSRHIGNQWYPNYNTKHSLKYRFVNTLVHKIKQEESHIL